MEFNIRQKKVLNATENKILCLAAAASGKALPNSMEIPTPNGYKAVGSIKEGDFLFDREGKPTKVLGVYPQGKKAVFKIELFDGRTVTCSRNHLWTVRQKIKGKYIMRTYDLNQLCKKGILINESTPRFYLPNNSAVEYDKAELLEDPYDFGKFLGFMNRVKELNERDKEFCSGYKEGYSDDYIGSDWKLGSIEQRWKLIKGIFDSAAETKFIQRETDGHIIKEVRVLLFGKKKFISDVREVFNSLGIITFPYKRDGLPNGYCGIRVMVSNIRLSSLFSKNKKKIKICKRVLNEKDRIETNYIGIRKIRRCVENEIIQKEEMTCFYVDNEEHLFLANNYIVTHNTRILTERVKRIITDLKVPPKDIVCICFTNMAADEMKKRLGDSANGAFIGTLHSFAAKICSNNGIDVEPYLEKEQFDELVVLANKFPRYKFPKISYLFVDECQDLSAFEYAFLERLPADNIFYVGDNRQSIYGFKGCTDEYLLGMHKDVNYTKYYLCDNYRNAPNIITFAEAFLSTMPQVSPPSNPMKTKNGYISECGLEEALEELEYSQKWGSWFVLTRTNRELEFIMDKLKEKEIPCVTFKKGDLDINSLDSIMGSNKVKVLTIHSAKGLEAQNVIVVGAKTYNAEERRISYVAATRAMHSLYWCPAIKFKTKQSSFKKSKPTVFSNGGMIEF